MRRNEHVPPFHLAFVVFLDSTPCLIHYGASSSILIRLAYSQPNISPSSRRHGQYSAVLYGDIERQIIHKVGHS